MGSLGDVVLVLLGAAAGGLVNGLTGFGTGITALPFWLHALTPVAATQLVAACSVGGQLTTLRAILPAVDWRRSMPMILAGVAGVPFGAVLVAAIDAASFKRSVGVIVIAYALFLLTRRPGAEPAARERDVTDRVLVPVGLVAGVLSGLAGLSGVLPTMLAMWLGWNKQRSRAFFQAFNLPVLAATLLVHLVVNGPATGLLVAFLTALPVTIASALLGQWIYRRMPTRRFQTVVLALLMLSGLSLIAGPWSAAP
jgi:uncharacterized membrane protein YfcA